jgi:hypothetical protein
VAGCCVHPGKIWPKPWRIEGHAVEAEVYSATHSAMGEREEEREVIAEMRDVTSAAMVVGEKMAVISEKEK